MKKIIIFLFFIPPLLSGCFLTNTFNKGDVSPRQKNKEINATENKIPEIKNENTKNTSCELKLYNNIAFERYIEGRTHIIYNN